MTPEQCRAARAYLNWSQPYLADMAGVSSKTVRNFEKRDYKCSERCKNKIQKALSKGGVIMMFGGVVPSAGGRTDMLREGFPIQ
jgi:DNA-binding XRE family transcriptional regulator